MTNKDDLKFHIDQLRKDKIIYATESIATTLAMTMIIGSILVFNPFNLSFFQINDQSIPVIPIIASLVAIGYWIYTSLGNLRRFNKIKELEKLL